MRTAIYAGSFDPITNGHFEVLKAAFGFADRVIVAIGIHPGKKPLFSFEERAALIMDCAKDYTIDSQNLDVVTFDGLLVDKAQERQASLIVRGLRDGSDFDYEMQLAGMNGRLQPDIQTIFVPAKPESRAITATLVRQIASMGGDVTAFVPARVAQALKDKFATSL